jgi:predicted RNA-binding Zn-ribbon protein involved in translation (DUF1610 family)
MARETKECNECESLYYSDTSKMMALCPDCSSQLYGYKNCNHQFENDRCVNCYWNGKSSKYIIALKKGL